VTAGQVHESKHFEEAIASVRSTRRRPTWIAGDKGYSAARIRAWCARRNIFDVIPQRSNQIEYEGPRAFSKSIYKERNVVERAIGHLKENRRITTRFEKLATSFLAMLKLAFLRRYLAILDPSNTA